MRFSLATLVLLVLWIGALMLIVERRDPWLIEKEASLLGERLATTAPDGRRLYCDADALFVADGPSLLWFKKIFHTPDVRILRAQFLNDNTISFDYGEVGEPSSSGRAHRRFPEWWWGHFYRPEVWLAITLSGLLIWRAAKSRRAYVARSSGSRTTSA